MQTLLLIPVFMFSLWLPQMERAIAHEPIQECNEACIVDLMNLAYKQGLEHGQRLCQPKLPDGPKVSRKKGINL